MKGPKLDAIRPSEVAVTEASEQLLQYQRTLEYDTKEFTIELLVQKFGSGDESADIFVPLYQRHFSWDEWRQSRFMESVLMGLPVPFLFFGDMADGRLEIVDGLQRLSTCSHFLRDQLVLVGCEKIPSLDGFRFSDLPGPQQRRLKNRTIRAVVLSQRATEEDRRDMFDRINTGSLIATPAEIRRGSISGPVSELIDQLATDSQFERLCPMSDANVRLRQREELITRFFALSDRFAEDLPHYKDRLSDYLDDWLKDANKMAKGKKKEVASLKKKFRSMLDFVEAYFPYGFAKKPQSKFTPNVRFDAIAVGVAEAQRIAGTEFRPKVLPVTWLTSDDFMEFTTSNAANVRSRIVNRIEYVRDRLTSRR